MHFYISGTKIELGEKKKVEIPVARLYDFTEMTLPVKVIRGAEDGPTVFLSAALHGDEINGVEIIRRVLESKLLEKLRGTIIAVPIVNVFGFNNRSRYLPDRKDLNRCFPGSPNGSLGSQLANIFVKEILMKSDYGIDIHTGVAHRPNLPQIRACLDDTVVRDMAIAFDAPVILNTAIIDGSLRKLAYKKRIPYIVFEGGEALRYDEESIKSGVRGILSVLGHLKILPKSKPRKTRKSTCTASSSRWTRSPHSGIFFAEKKLGDRVVQNSLLGIVADPFGEDKIELRSPKAGIIIGASRLPLVSEGDALFNIASFDDSRSVKISTENFEDIPD